MPPAKAAAKPPAARPAPAAPPKADTSPSSGHAGSGCREPACDQPATARGYCRLHYIKNWKLIKARERKAARKRLHALEDELIHKVPLEYEDRADRLQSPVARSLDLEITRAREDVEEMFREMGFDDEM